MTPDRSEHRDSADDAVVLSDAVGVDTTSINLLGGGTAQVNVVVPGSGSDDDDADDDVIGDEVAMGDGFDGGDGFDDGAVIPDEDAPSESGEAYPADQDDVEDAVLVADADQAAADDDELDEAATEGFAEADEPVTDSEVDAETVPEPTSDATLATVEPPATRRAAHQTAPIASPRGGGSPASPRTGGSAHTGAAPLASKRLGEFESDRESPDLLTADRLLDQERASRPEPEGGWSRLVYSVTRGRVNLGDGKRARERKALDLQIAAPLTGGARFVSVLSRKGGVGKTTITTLLGMALADARDDRVIAIDANPDRGTLADRIDKSSGQTVRDLVRARDTITGYNDISSIVSRDRTRLDVLASDADPTVSEAFSDEDYEDVARIAAHYYSLVLTDTGTGIVHSVMSATLSAADQLVVVSGLSIDEARLASETLTWLETNGFREQVRNAVVVLNTARPGAPLVRAGELQTHFSTRVRSVVQMPYDPHLGTGSAIVFRDLQPATRDAARRLAAAVVAGLRGESGAA